MAVRQDASTGELIDDGKAAEQDSKKTADGKPLMDVKVYSPFKVYYEGPATSISAASATGPFDILPKHHNFITLLVPCDVIVRKEDGEETITINNGVMHVKADDIVIFLDV